MFAKARTGLVTEELDGELLVLDVSVNVAHCLSPDSAAVWRACDGQRDLHALAVHTALDHECVRAALDVLERQGLLEPDPDEVPVAIGRRQVLRRFATTAVAAASVPLLTSALLPTVAFAGSGMLCATCTSDNGCQTGDACLASGASSYCIPANCSFSTAACSSPCSMGLTKSGTCTTVSCGSGHLCCT